jgi:hypothetical protein
MKKMFKKFISIVLSSVMFFQSGVFSFAGENKSIKNCDLQNEISNKMISEGYLEIKDGKVFITEKYKSFIEKKLAKKGNGTYAVFEDDTIIIKSNKNAMGETKIQWTTWGFEIWIDENFCNDILAGTAIAEKLATYIPEVALAEAVAWALIGAATLITVNNHGKGVIVMFNLVPLCIRWISSQE